jgi:hypothetical protein
MFRPALRMRDSRRPRHPAALEDFDDPSATLEMPMAPLSDRTRLIATATRRGGGRRPVNPPIERASTLLSDSVGDMRDGSLGPLYGIEGTASQAALRRAIADLEGATDCWLAPSGLMAVTLPLLALTRPGDEILTTDAVYGPIRRFLNRHLAARGISTRFHPAKASAAELVAAIGKHIESFYGADPQASPDYTRIVNDAHFHRIEKLLHNGTVAHGGTADADTRYIAPTVLTGITRDDPVMGEEIFGPVLPVIAVDSLDEAIAFVNADDKPLALYSFSEHDADNDRVLAGATSGGACVNGTLMHISNPNLPFGGVGESGMGAYHGKIGFDTMSHRRSVLTRSTKIDPSLMYPPYTAKKEKLVKRGMTLGDPRDSVAQVRGRFRRH